MSELAFPRRGSRSGCLEARRLPGVMSSECPILATWRPLVSVHIDGTGLCLLIRILPSASSSDTTSFVTEQGKWEHYGSTLETVKAQLTEMPATQNSRLRCLSVDIEVAGKY